MKRKKAAVSVISLFLCIVLLISVFSAAAITGEHNDSNEVTENESVTDAQDAQSLILGDVNSDGEVSLSDAIQIQKNVLSVIEFNNSQMLCADVDKNDAVNLVDCILVQKYNLEMPADDLGIGKPVEYQPTTDTQTDPTQLTDPTDETQTATDETEPATQTDPTEETTSMPTDPVTEQTDPTEETTTVQTDPTVPDTVELNKNSITLGVGESYTLIKSSPTGTDLSTAVFSSDNDAAVIVDSSSGKITAFAVGQGVITITTQNGATASCVVTVKTAPTSITLNKSEITLGIGETYDLNSSLPSGEGAYRIIYSSNNSSVASVKASGGLVSANKTGSAIITATAYNGVKVSCTVTVKKAPTKIKLNKLSVSLKAGETFDLNSSLPSGEGAYHVVYSTDNKNVAEVKAAGGLVTAKGKGIAIITATAYNGVKTYCAVSIGSNTKTLSFKDLCQFPELPTGCEVTSLTAVLNYYGFDVSKTTMASKYLPKHTGAYYTGDFRYEFIGDPYRSDGFGCYAPCIVTTAENYFKSIGKNSVWYAEDLSGCAPELLYAQILKGNPVVIWATSGWVMPTVNAIWTGRNNEQIAWLRPEHCLTLIGFNQNNSTVTVSDDATGTSYSIAMSTFESVFKAMGSQAVIIKQK